MWKKCHKRRQGIEEPSARRVHLLIRGDRWNCGGGVHHGERAEARVELEIGSDEVEEEDKLLLESGENDDDEDDEDDATRCC